MILFRGAALLLVLFLALAGVVRAETLTHARVGFSAERILSLNGRRYAGRMWYMPGAERQEQAIRGLNPIFILSENRRIADILLPQLHTVAELPIPDALSLLRDPGLLAHPIARARIDGFQARVYAIHAASSLGRARGRLWLSAQGIPLKAEGRYESPKGRITKIRWRLHEVKIGPQAPSLFAVPKGFSRLSPQALAPLLNLKPLRAPLPRAAH